jgi:hypothetical protein
MSSRRIRILEWALLQAGIHRHEAQVVLEIARQRLEQQQRAANVLRRCGIPWPQTRPDVRPFSESQANGW